jgi:MFS family permease
MSSFHRLLASASLAHFADQLAFAALPLAAVLLLEAGPGTVGALVAVQGAAWLILSLPGGVIADRMSRSRLIGLSQAAAAIAFLAACAAASIGWWTGFGALLFVGAGGAVFLMLSALSLVPALVAREHLPAANARLELARAVMTFLAPAIAGFVAAKANPALAFGLAGAVSAAAAIFGFRIKSPAPVATVRPPVFTAIREGAAFAFRHELLRGIVLCAVFWNFAFFALLAVIVPFGLDRVGLDPRAMGLAQSGNGLGMMAGAAIAGWLLARAEPRIILVLGPALSLLAAGLMLASPGFGGVAALFVGFVLLGFGPMMWLVCQTSIRQLVTPAPLLGRVASLVQVAIYGVRPLGALAGGWVAVAAGLEAALVLVIASFALSAAVPLLTALGRLRSLPEPQAS